MIYGDEPQQIGEYEDPLGTSRYVYAPQITAVMQAGNLYGYGLGDPIRHFDPSGEIAVTTIILIGAAVVGLIAAGVEAHQSKKYTGKINWENTIIAGVSWFFIAATLGLTAYEVYLSYCAYTGQTPVTEVNFNGNDTVTHNGNSGSQNTNSANAFNILNNKTLTNQTSKVNNYTSSKTGLDCALEEFYKMNPSNIRAYPNGTLVGELPDGRTINLHASSTLNGVPTVEIYNSQTGNCIKIRY